jgi:hypothetical protein
MLDIALLASGLGIVVNAAPGAVFAESLRRGMRGGFRGAFAVQVGSLVGDAVWAILGLAGVGALFLLDGVRVPLMLDLRRSDRPVPARTTGTGCAGDRGRVRPQPGQPRDLDGRVPLTSTPVITRGSWSTVQVAVILLGYAWHSRRRTGPDVPDGSEGSTGRAGRGSAPGHDS